MKNIKLSLFVLVFISTILLNINASAQKYPIVKTAEKGILIYPEQEIPKNSFYKIERSIAGQNSFKVIAILTSPKSFYEFSGLVKVYSALFSFNTPKDSNIVKNIWEEFRKNDKSTKLKGMINLPLFYAALGMLYYDTNVVLNQKYQYKTSFIKNAIEGVSVISENISYPIKADIGKILLYKSQAYENNISIHWYITENNKPYNFNVYRQEVSKRDYKKIVVDKGFNNNKDTLFLIVNDQAVNKDENYNYYIEPIDNFGNKGNISEIVRIAASSINTLPVITKFEVKTSTRKDGLMLKWRFERIKYLRSISIFRSLSFDKDFIKIAELPSDDSLYTDKSVLQGYSYYYYIVINALNNQTNPSAKVSGFYSTDLKPFPPQALKSENLNNGIKLSWRCIEENIAGFFVYRCEGIKGKMIQISDLVKKGVPLSVYLDTSSNFGRKPYSYAVKTVSKSMVESIFSDTVCVFPTASKEPPMTPTRISARLYNNSILIIWDNMYQTNPYLAGYNMYRKEKKDKEYKLINDDLISNSKNSYTDTSISKGQEFSYQVESIDVFSNKSGKSIPTNVVLSNSVPISASGIKLYSLEEGISIIWDETVQDNLVSYKIYRYGEKGDPKLIYTSKPDERKFIDNNVKKDELYFYYVTSLDIYGNESEPANEVSIRR